MAKDAQPQRPIHELTQEIAHSRDRLARDLTGLRYELDFPLKFRKSFQRATPVWISAAVLTGVVLTARALPSRKKIVYVKGGQQKKGEEQKKGLLQAGLAMGVLKMAATLLRPIVVRFVTNKIGSYAGSTPGGNRKWK